MKFVKNKSSDIKNSKYNKFLHTSYEDLFAHDCDILILERKESQTENGEKLDRLWEDKLGRNYVLNCENSFGCMVVAVKFEKQVVSRVQKKSVTTAVESTGLLFP